MGLLEPTVAPTPDDILSDPTQSDWIKAAVQDLELRDPLDALNDVIELKNVMERRFVETLERAK